MAIKIDMEKAFDHMEWNFLFAILANLVSTTHGSTGSVSASFHLHSPSSSMVVPMVTSLRPVVFGKVISYLHSYLF